VAKNHASIRVMGDDCELEVRDVSAPVLVNNRPVQRTRLRHGDNISIGRTSFVFQRRKS
jgi:pSer/pThr/pTyr-binding forkhead associated (FHA) protein